MKADYLVDSENEIKKYFETCDIPDFFYACLFGEIIKVRGTNFLIQDKYYDAEFDEEGNLIKSNEESYSYKRQIEYFLVCQGGTYGWAEAFEKTCVQCNITYVYEYYTKLDWILSDIFDGYVIDKMLKILNLS